MGPRIRAGRAPRVGQDRRGHRSAMRVHIPKTGARAAATGVGRSLHTDDRRTAAAGPSGVSARTSAGGTRLAGTGLVLAPAMISRGDAMNERMLWERFQQHNCQAPALGLSLDVSRMRFEAEFLERMAAPMQQAFTAM